MIKIIKKNNTWYVVKRQNSYYGFRKGEQPVPPQNAMYVDNKLIVDENNNPVVFEVNQ